VRREAGIIDLPDRIVVARQGRIAEEFDSRNATEENVMSAAVH
jgi:ABC-type sugar transport system ATPase subunit